VSVSSSASPSSDYQATLPSNRHTDTLPVLLYLLVSHLRLDHDTIEVRYRTIIVPDLTKAIGERGLSAVFNGGGIGSDTNSVERVSDCERC
jgi:hypothetical protein